MLYKRFECVLMGFVHRNTKYYCISMQILAADFPLALKVLAMRKSASRINIQIRL